MGRAARTIAVSVPALVVIAVAWLRLEQPVGSLWRAAALLVLALAAALPRRRWSRVIGAVIATVVAARIAVGVDLVPWRPGHAGSFSVLGTQLGDGFSDFYGTTLPFDPRVHVAMHELVLVALFLFALGLALLVAARKPVAAALVLLAGAGWPATLLGPSRGIAMGGAVLAALLVVFAGLGSRRLPALALPLGAAVVVAAVAVGSATAARHGLVRWQSWNLAHIAGGPSDIGFVWNAQYGGLHWSGHPTNVLQVQSDRPPTYLRAAVLDDFVGDAWVLGPSRPADSLEPRAALLPQHQTREVVTVNALADAHLVGSSIPIRFVAAGGAPLLSSGPGFAALDQNLPHGFRYMVWSHTTRPSAAALRRSPPDYPSQLTLDDMLDVGDGATLPAFGTPYRRENVAAIVGLRQQLLPYLALARVAERVAGRARTPYGAVEDLERWFVSSHTFRYSNHPPVAKPALVGFVTKTHAGYCQYFAGAMALMLRYLGIPARVAVGFAGGTYDSKQRVWNVSDREAHAWVEVWFKGYGWLPFDPTPVAPGAAPRHYQAGLSASGTGGSGPSSPPSGGALAVQGASAFEQKLAENSRFGSRARQQPGRHHGFLASELRLGSGSSGSSGSSDRSRPLLLLLAGLAVAVGVILLTKLGHRLTRSVRRDPRAVASACRQELASFLVDQRIEAPHSATLGELGEIVKHEFGVDSEEFVAAATAARFGPSEGAAAAAVTARRELRAVLELARRSLTRWDRARGLLSLRSLTRPAAGMGT